MSPRKTILRELHRVHEKGGDHTRPSTIPGFSANTAKYQSAVNDLLKDQLINGRKDEGGQMAIAINPHRADQVRRELRPFMARPAAWIATVGLLVTAAAGLILL